MRPSSLILMLMTATSMAANANTDLESITPWELSVSMGRATADINRNQLQSQVGDGMIVSTTDHDTSVQFKIGYRYLPELLLQLGYLDMGQGEIALTHNTLDPNGYQSSVSTAGPILVRGLTLGGQYNVASWQDWTLYAEAGAFLWLHDNQSKMGSIVHSHNEKGVDAYWGAGVKYALHTHWDAFVGYQHYHLDPNNVSHVELGFRLKY